MIPSSRTLLTVHIKKLPDEGEGVNDSHIYGLCFIVNSLSVVLVLMFENFSQPGLAVPELEGCTNTMLSQLGLVLFNWKEGLMRSI
jgi:hypothetical protein